MFICLLGKHSESIDLALYLPPKTTKIWKKKKNLKGKKTKRQKDKQTKR